MIGTETASTVSTPLLGRPALWLRIEGLVLLVGAVVAYGTLVGNWWLFALLLFAPDLFMIGYMSNPVWGAALYNVGHTYLLPALLLGVGWWMGWQFAIPIALIWIAHIGLDRLVGYGLKYPTAFKDTHLQHV